MAKILYTDANKDTIDADNYKIAFDNTTNPGTNSNSIIVDTVTKKDAKTAGSNKTTNGLFYVDSTLDSSETGVADISGWPLGVPVYLDHWDLTSSAVYAPGLYIKTSSTQTSPTILSVNDVDYDITDICEVSGTPAGLDMFKVFYNPSTGFLTLNTHFSSIAGNINTRYGFTMLRSLYNDRHISASGAMMRSFSSDTMLQYCSVQGYVGPGTNSGYGSTDLITSIARGGTSSGRNYLYLFIRNRGSSTISNASFSSTLVNFSI